MSTGPREFFTVDLRGLRAALTARATSQALTESDVLRSALAASLGTVPSASHPVSSNLTTSSTRTPHIKLSVRLPSRAAERLAHNARSAGLSRGAYLTRLVEGAPPVVASSDRAAMFNALRTSSDELAVLSREINKLTRLLRHGVVDAARVYAKRHEQLEADVRRHLALAASVLAELSSLHVAGESGAIDARHERRS